MFPSARTRCRLSDEHKRDSGWMKQWATWPNLVTGPAPKFGEEVESQTGALPEAGSAVLSQALIRPESVQPQPAPHTWADSQQRKKRCQSRACPVPVLLQEGASQASGAASWDKASLHVESNRHFSTVSELSPRG